MRPSASSSRAEWRQRSPNCRSRALRLPVETVDALRRLGVERIGQVAAMPSAPLTRRFGADVRRRLDQALGHAAEPFDALMPPEVIRRRLAFAEPIGAGKAFRAWSRVYVSISAVTSLQGARRAPARPRVRSGRSGVPSRSGEDSRPNRDPAHLARLLGDRLDFIDPGFGIEACAARRLASGAAHAQADECEGA